MNKVDITYLNSDPFLVSKGGPDVMWFCDGCFVRFQADFRTIGVHVQRSKDKNQTRETGIRWDGLQPIVIQVEQHHLWFSSFQNQIAQFFNL